MNIKKALLLSFALLSMTGLMQAMVPQNIIKEETRFGIRYTDPNSNRWVQYDPSTGRYFGQMPGSLLTPRMYLETGGEEYGQERFLAIEPRPTGTQDELRGLYNSLRLRYEQRIEKG